MDLRSVLQLANDILDDPLRAKFSSIWSGYSVASEVVQTTDGLRFSGEIESLSLPGFRVQPCRFTLGADSINVNM